MFIKPERRGEERRGEERRGEAKRREEKRIFFVIRKFSFDK